MYKNHFILSLGLFLGGILNAQEKVVLIEQFSNASCPNCGQYSPPVYNFANANKEKTTVISYHTSFPHYDGIYLENPTEVNDRVNYYSVQGVPNTVLDGNFYNGSSYSLLPTISTKVNNRALIQAKYSIQSTDLEIENNLLKGKFIFQSIDNSNGTDDLVAHLVVIEKDVQRNSYTTAPGNNSENHYEFVMRKMYPNSSGTVLINKELNEKDSINFELILQNIKNTDELQIIAFVQNNTTKEVFQSQLFTPDIKSASVNEIEIKNPFSIYPNPSNGLFVIDFNTENEVDEIVIYNQAGSIVYTKTVNENTQKLNINLQLENGFYYLKTNKNTNQLKKISIIN